MVIGLMIYLGLLAAGSLNPGPRAWGLHLIGFLPGGLRLAIWTTLLTAFALVLTGTALVGLIPDVPMPRDRRRERAWGRWALPIFLVLAGILFWAFRARTQFLGDGALWLSSLQTGELIRGNEPLAQAAWIALAKALHSAGMPIAAGTVAPFSVACGLVAMGLTWGLARELTRESRQFPLALSLVATIGSTQLFFGYIESYPPVAVLILAFLYVGLRVCRGASSPLGAGLILALAIAGHLGCVYLFPAFAYLVVDRVESRTRKALELALPLALALAFTLLLGFGPTRWLETFRIAAWGLAPQNGFVSAIREARPYSALSWDHALDLANEILLVIPVPLILTCGGIAATWPRLVQRLKPRQTFLGVAAASALLSMFAIVLPLAPAQDWDLFSLFLVPVGLFGISISLHLLSNRGGKMISLGMMLIAASALASFVLVNASPTAGERRFETLIGAEAKISPFARMYGYEVLAYYHRHQGDPRSALRYAEAALKSEPTNTRFWALVGGIRLNMGDYAGAILYLEGAIARGRSAAGTWTNLGICYSHVGRQPEALEMFRAAAAKEPNRPDYQLNLALALINAGEPDSARALLIQTVRRWPRYAPAIHALERRFRGHSAGD